MVFVKRLMGDMLENENGEIDTREMERMEKIVQTIVSYDDLN